MCLSSEQTEFEAQIIIQQAALGRPEHRPQVLKQIFFFFVHIANIPEELREDHLHGYTSTDQHSSGRQVKRVPAVYINHCKKLIIF